MRGQLFRALPKHLLWAALLGAVGGVLLYFLKDIRLSGMWNLLMFIPLAAVHVNAAVLPVAIPGRHWGFGYIGAIMLFFLLIAGTVLSNKLEFPHARVGDTELVGVNIVTYWALLTGGLLGLLYGLIAGRTGAMVMGLMIGSLAGYGLGIGYAGLFPTGMPRPPFGGGMPHDSWAYVTFEWYGMALLVTGAMVVLHAMSLIGAALGADRE